MNNNEYWKNKWEMNDIAFHDDYVNPTLRKYLPKLNLKTGDTLFVPLCGKSIDMIWLAQQGFNVIGVELSSIACQEFFNSQNMEATTVQQGNFTIYESHNIKLYCGDIFNLKKDDLVGVSAIYDWKALIALPKEIRENYVKHLIDCSSKDVKILLITLEAKQDVVGPPYSISEDEIQSHFSPLFNIEKIEEKVISPLPEHLDAKGWNGGVRKTHLILN